jgi:hypothetical protein
MAQWELWLILFFLAWILVGFGNDLLVLRQYGLLDHSSCFSVDRKGNIPLTNFALRRIREGDEKTSGAFNDADVMDQKAIVEGNGSMGFDQSLVGWTILTPVIFMLIPTQMSWLLPGG